MKKRLTQWLIRGFGEPTGAAGRIAAFVMAHRSSNVRRSRWAVELLDLQSTDRFLELGCGPGVALAAARARTPHVVGVDRSDVMVPIARRRSRAIVVHADAVNLPSFDESFDKALAINTLAFWSDPVAGLCRVHAAMRPGATIAIVSQPRGGAFANPDEVIAQLADAGFAHERTEVLDIEPPAVCVIARA